jgi:hypothetical protein
LWTAAQASPLLQFRACPQRCPAALLVWWISVFSIGFSAPSLGPQSRDSGKKISKEKFR